jgi:hypothetical protein
MHPTLRACACRFKQRQDAVDGAGTWRPRCSAAACSASGCPAVSASMDLSPLETCSQTLEELWMAGHGRISSLAFEPLNTTLVHTKVCTRLRKLDLRDCYLTGNEDEEDAAVDRLLADLRLTCTQLLASPASVKLEGLVHPDLQLSIPPHAGASST